MSKYSSGIQPSDNDIATITQHLSLIAMQIDTFINFQLGKEKQRRATTTQEEIEINSKINAHARANKKLYSAIVHHLRLTANRDEAMHTFRWDALCGAKKNVL